MKSKVITLVAIAAILFSCASKKSVPTAAAVEPVKAVELAPTLVEGKSLYGNNCAKCHELYEPTAHSSEDWKPILARMQKKAHLDDAQMASISDYISSQL